MHGIPLIAQVHVDDRKNVGTLRNHGPARQGRDGGGLPREGHKARPGSAGVLAGKDAAGTAAVEETLKLAPQIGEALEAAHDRGIAHRDLKPANIKVTSDGKAKVLDIGLAKAFAVEQEAPNLIVLNWIEKPKRLVPLK